MSKPFTYEMTVKYEVARELLNAKRAALSARIWAEERRPSPDKQVVEELNWQMGKIAVEINQLDVTDEAMLDASIAANRRVKDNR